MFYFRTDPASWQTLDSNSQSAETRFDRRDILRDAVFL